VATRLRRRYPPELVAAAMTLHDLRRHARTKFARANQMFFTRAGLEQSTSERIAEWRAQRYAYFSVLADLCCGIGGDLVALAQLPEIARLIAVDLDPDHLAMAIANASVHAPDLTIQGRLEDVRAIELAGIEGVFIDPARRNQGGRFVGGASEPPLEWALDLAQRVPAVGIKTAPGISHELVPEGWELETIALGHDLKEAALWSPAIATAIRRATIVTEQGIESMSANLEDDPLPAAIVTPVAGMWLHDPNPAVTRAGLVQHLAQMVGAAQIDEQIAFLVTADHVISPFARSLPIIASEPWNEKHLRQTLRELDAGPIDIRRRGLAGDVDAIGKRVRQKSGRPVMLAMTRHHDKPWAIICDDIPAARS
ncbi:MAG: class I SAM-dependent methyltransferase, partial [Thermomicrobiales bacterium]